MAKSILSSGQLVIKARPDEDDVVVRQKRGNPSTVYVKRERREDIPALMEHFLARYFRRRGGNLPGVSQGVRQAFMRYGWPGNVRELENACERIAQTCTCGTVRAGCVPATLPFRAGAHQAKGCAPSTPAHETAPISLDKRVRALEIELITGALNATHGNKVRPEFLQMNRSTLVARMNRCGLGRAAARPELVSLPA